MFTNREIKFYTAGCMAAVLVTALYGICAKEKASFFLVAFGAVFFLYIIGLLVFASFFKSLERMRLAASEIIKKESRDYHVDMPEKYMEGEIGKLAESLSELTGVLQESEEKQRREKEFLRDMISDISHQLKTPISSLTVFTDLLMEDAEKGGCLLAEKKKEMLTQSGIQLERMTWLISSMLQLARIEADSIVFQNEETDIGSLLESCTMILRERADEKRQRFVFTGDKNCKIFADAKWLKEALINIIKNAVDYAPEDSEIILDVRQTPIATKISIQDFGCGIPEAERLNIFKRFYRISENSVNPSSVGIGLALSQSIIKGMGGRIRVESLHTSQCYEKEKSYTKMIITF